MIKNLKSLTAQRQLGPILVSGLLLVIGIYQISLLIEQFNPNFPNTDTPLSRYLHYVSRAIVSIGVTALLWKEFESLEEFHIDKFALMTFILGSLLQPKIGIMGEGYISILVILTGILITVAWIVKKPTIPRSNRRWIFLGIMVGGTSVIVIALLEQILDQLMA